MDNNQSLNQTASNRDTTGQKGEFDDLVAADTGRRQPGPATAKFLFVSVLYFWIFCFVILSSMID